MKTIPVNLVHRNEYVRKPGQKKVYIRKDYDRSTKRYELQDAEDINRFITIKATALVEVGFTY